MQIAALRPTATTLRRSALGAARVGASSVSDDDLDDVWDKVGGADPGPPADEGPTPEEVAAAMGPPIRATFVVRADKVPVAPWAQGWRVGAIGPNEGHITLVCEHEMDASPVAQLSAITGILGTLKQAQLDVVFWAIQTRGPLELTAPADIDEEFGDLLADQPDAADET